MEGSKTKFISTGDDKKVFAIDSPFPIIDDNDNHINLGFKKIIKKANRKSSFTLENENVNSQSEETYSVKHNTSFNKSNATNGSIPANGYLQSEKGTCKETEIKVYKRRWYILFVYCVLSFTQATLWNTWGPIAQTSESAFGWTDADIALFTNLGPIAFLFVVFLISWIVDTKGWLLFERF